MKTIVYISVIMLLLAGCSKTIPLYNDDSFEPNLVVSAFLAPGDSIRVIVTKTEKPAQLDSNVFIHDAKVQIIENGQVVANLHENTDIYAALDNLKHYAYTSDYQLLEGHTYTVKVQALGKTITKDVTFPPKVEISSIITPQNNDFINFLTQDFDTLWGIYFDTTFTITFDDPPEQENYYMFDFMVSYPIIGYDSTYTSAFAEGYFQIPIEFYFSVFDENFKYITGTLPYYADRYFSCIILPDAEFNGNTFSVKVSINGQTMAFDGDSLKIYCKLITISKDLFKYYVSEEKARNTAGNPFVEPVNLYSNIESEEDFGIITGYNYTIDSVTIPINFPQ